MLLRNRNFKAQRLTGETEAIEPDMLSALYENLINIYWNHCYASKHTDIEMNNKMTEVFDAYRMDVQERFGIESKEFERVL